MIGLFQRRSVNVCVMFVGNKTGSSLTIETTVLLLLLLFEKITLRRCDRPNSRQKSPQSNAMHSIRLISSHNV